ncbi:HAD family hydrolase [Paenibacillus dakarensis]|uniref:HAD family hydrolase n=1 Tax=Paenibacillus dakarensis TaxID=1527293 RepID=UPI0006D533D0|nr:HAD family hydrolase [Paenibacillus dakarensis]
MTLVHEDDEIIPLICNQIKENSENEKDYNIREIGSCWWREFSGIFKNSYGDSFQSQRTIGIASLARTIETYQSKCNAEELIQVQFEHWIQPKIYSDTIAFLQTLQGIPVYILSNIDTSDILKAVHFHQIKVTDILTSEDVKSYKPRPELFQEALKRSHLKADEVIHIGDSLLSDVTGAQNLGITAVWLNRLNKTLPEGILPDYVCKDLNEVSALLLSDYEKH